MSCCDCRPNDSIQRSTLITLLAINGSMFFAEAIAGIIAQSAGLMADSLDMLADAAVYGISLYAIGRCGRTKARAAHWSGIFQIVLALGVLGDVVRRTIVGSEPEPAYMLIVGTLALVANVICLRLIYAHRAGEVHMRASWIFSKNDVIANAGVIAGGLIVRLTGASWPDLAIGAIIAVLVFQGGLSILKEAQAELVGEPATELKS